MSRKRTKDKHLPRSVYHRHGAYYHVKNGKWTRLADTLASALAEYGRILEPQTGGCDELFDRTLDRFREKLKEKAISANTFEAYDYACRQLKKNFSEFKPDQIKAQHVAALMDLDRDKPSMANRKLSFLKTAFQYALTWGMAEMNPAHGVQRHTEEKRTRLITDEEFRRMREKAAPHVQIVMDLARCTGQRIMDVVGIRLADISEEGIYFRQQKTGKQIMVRMNAGIRDAVERAKRLHTNVRGLTLLHQRGGKPYPYQTIRKHFVMACEAAGVQDYRFNDHRAKALTDAKRQGKNATKLAGHTTESMTVRYLRDREAEVVDGVDFGQTLDNWTGEAEKSGT
jgi:integrase